MISGGMEIFAKKAVEQAVNSLPEGVLIGLGAWLLLRLIGRQNSGTRFAVWLIALVGVAALPFLGGFGAAQYPATPHSHAEFSVSSFWALAFLALWIPVAATALARLVAGLWQIRQIRRSCTEIDPANLDPALKELFEQTKKPVRLLVSEKVRVPAALGFRDPSIVLPSWTLRDLTSVELQSILIHELAHLRRYDGWTNLFQKTLCAIFFFHPVVWWLDARLSLEREMACDDAVLVATGDPHAYAECLVSLLERSCIRRGWNMAQTAVTRAHEASQRIARILRIGGSATTGIARPALGMTAALAIACSGVALYAPHLLVFAPDLPASVAHVQPRRLANQGINFPAAAIIPASFHPTQRPGLVQNAVMTRTISANRHGIASAAPRKARKATKPGAMVSFITPVGSKPPVAATLFVVADTSTVGLGPTASVLFDGVVPKLQERDQPEMQIQTLQFVEEDAAGFHIQLIRVLINMPTLNAQRSGLISQVI